jgi:hypothetical protein
MPENPEIPKELEYLLTTNVPAHVTLTKADGSLVTHIMWIDYDGEHILIGSPSESYKSRAFRVRRQVAISVVDPADQWRRLSISGRVTGIRDDAGLALINKLSMRYTGQPYQRTTPREVFEVTMDRVRPMLGRRVQPVEPPKQSAEAHGQ